jgi:hypothetical protein
MAEATAQLLRSQGGRVRGLVLRTDLRDQLGLQ